MQLVHDLLNGTAATDGGHEAPCALGALPDAAAVGSWVPISPAAVHLQLELLRPDKGAAARVHLYTVTRLPLTAIDCHCVDLRSDPVGAAVRLGGSQLLGCREGAGARGISVADVSAGRPLVLRGRLRVNPDTGSVAVAASSRLLAVAVLAHAEPLRSVSGGLSVLRLELSFEAGALGREPRLQARLRLPGLC